jgi:hypothetical protein
MLQSGNYRLPVAFELVRRADHLPYRSETRLFRWMLRRFRRPWWTATLIVVAEATFAFKANVKLIQRRGYFPAGRRCVSPGWAVEQLIEI